MYPAQVSFSAESPTLLWFRRDLRVSDNPALIEAARGLVIPVFLLEEDLPRPPGQAARWWLHHSLLALERSLRSLGAPLILRRGRAVSELPRLVKECQASAVMWNDRVEPGEKNQDDAVAAALIGQGIRVQRFAPPFLFDPAHVGTSGRHYRIFTPFWRSCLAQPDPGPPLQQPSRLHAPECLPTSDRLENWHLEPTACTLAALWTPGENMAQCRLSDFMSERLGNYEFSHDRIDQDSTSRLSPHLAFGEITPRQIWQAGRKEGASPYTGFLRQLGWREFCYHVLNRSPELAKRPQRQEFETFPWSHDEERWDAFITGQTGFPLIDAGIRALLETGWLHNRLRMILGSFLVKDLLIPWQRGEQWFWETLLDADPAANAGGWQWIAGCGLESTPYFRIFNPTLQGEKFDRQGTFTRAWLPELASLPTSCLHKPWRASPATLLQARVRLGIDYPYRLLNHEEARRTALNIFHHLPRH